jgi:hypothetical protein
MKKGPLSLLKIKQYSDKTILGWYNLEPLQRIVKESKVVKSFSWTFYFKGFHNFNFFLIYPLHALMYGLKFILELKKLKLFKDL